MEIVRKIGGGSYGRADIFRKGIGSKNKELIQEESKKLYNEIVANGYSSEIAEKITSVLSVMGGYGFNFSHSLCYSVLTLQTAYLKAHYTNYFYKALLNHNLNNFGVLNKYIIEAKKLGVKLLPPNINKSQVKFSIQDGNILFGLSAIVGIGEKVLEKVLEEREKQKFKSLDDLRDRTGLTIAQLVILIKSGAIPTNNKKNMLYKLAQSTCGTRTFTPLKTTSGTLLELKTLYNIDTKDKEERLRLYNIAREKEFYEKEKIRVKTHMDDFYNKYALDEEYWEFQALSVFIENNPFEDIYNYVVPFDDVEDFNQATVVGIISNVQKKKDKNKKTFAYITIYSSFGTLEMVCWHTQFKDYEDLIKRGNKIAILCDKKEGKAYVKKMKTLEEWKKENMVMPKEYNLRKD
jgi:DNA polymerase-3 subunit alpha